MKISNYALIIGSMKCGTTSLFCYLAEHPEISACSIKEPNFFADDTSWARGIQWYESLWDWDPHTHKVALEASTHYTKIPGFPNAAARVATVPASFKFIYIVRNPLDRIESHYMDGLSHSWGRNRSFNEAVDPQAIEISRYAMQLDEYKKRFPPENILIINFEDLKADAHSVMRSVCEFLEIDSNYRFQGLGTSNNPSRGKWVNGDLWHYLRNIEPLRKCVKSIIPSRYRDLAHKKSGYRIKSRMEMPLDIKKHILKELEGDLYKLKTTYGVDIARWNLGI